MARLLVWRLHTCNIRKAIRAEVLRNTGDMTRHHSPEDEYIPYGRGGAGNMRKSQFIPSHHAIRTPPLTPYPGRKSAIRESWFKILASEPAHSPLVLTSSPEDHYAASKSEPRRRSTHSSSAWSTSTAGERRSGWRRWWLGRRKESVAEEGDGVGKEDDSDR